VLLRRRIVRLERSPADGKIVTVSLERDSEEAERVEPRLVIDATYEADSLPMASTPFRLGRESRVEFGEMNAGRVFMSVSRKQFLRGSTGRASARVPAMTWRLCFTTNASNRFSLAGPPEGYNRSRYLKYFEDVKSGRANSSWDAWSHPRPLPPSGAKYDINCNPTLLGFVWAGSEKERYIAAYGAANASARAASVSALRNLTLGLLWFLQHDDQVPASERSSNLRYGLCGDEFARNGHFPYQLYVREGRRLRGRTTFTEADMVPLEPTGRPPIRSSSVAIGSFPIDAFPATGEPPDPAEDSLRGALEGYVGMQKAMVAPSTLPSEMLLTDATPNLIVAGGVSASHVAFSAIRLEPTWMLLGGAAGLLASLAVAHDSLPSEVPHIELQREVVRRGGHPIILYNDLSLDDPAYEAMQVLGPHGVADESGWAARARQTLYRHEAVRWIHGVLAARHLDEAHSLASIVVGVAPTDQTHDPEGEQAGGSSSHHHPETITDREWHGCLTRLSAVLQSAQRKSKRAALAFQAPSAPAQPAERARAAPPPNKRRTISRGAAAQGLWAVVEQSLAPFER
jgi:hypothetical protein